MQSCLFEFFYSHFSFPAKFNRTRALISGAWEYQKYSRIFHDLLWEHKYNNANSWLLYYLFHSTYIEIIRSHEYKILSIRTTKIVRSTHSGSILVSFYQYTSSSFQYFSVLIGILQHLFSICQFRSVYQFISSVLSILIGIL